MTDALPEAVPPRADRTRGFYEDVVGWSAETVNMGGYGDFTVRPPSGAAGGPPHVLVEDVERSALACTRLGGVVLAGPQPFGGGQLCVIRDPAGAVCALYQAGR